MAFEKIIPPSSYACPHHCAGAGELLKLAPSPRQCSSFLLGENSSEFRSDAALRLSTAPCEHSFGCIIYPGVKLLAKANTVLSLEHTAWPGIL